MGGRGARRPETIATRRPGARLADHLWVPSRTQVAEALAAALRPPDPTRVSGPVRRYSPTGQLLETLSVEAWAQRYPRRFAPTRGANRHQQRQPPRPF